MKKFRFHILGLVHLPTTKHYLSCAFTQKNIKLCKMLCSLGHTVYFYGAKSTEGKFDLKQYVNSPNFHFIKTHTVEDIARDYGSGDNRYELGYNWENEDFRHDINKERKPSTLKFYKNCIEHINKIKRPDDFLLCTQGIYHKPIADAVKLFLTCESGIGYRGSVKAWFRAFESAYIQNYTYGHEGNLECINGSYYDRVIPNYFDPADIKYSDKKKDYYLFIGRLIKRKGVLIAYLATKAIGAKLIMAGQGASIDERGYLVDNKPQEFEIAPDSNWEYIGFADVEKRKELMAHAKAVFVPTEYLEIFGGTHVEAMLSGTPVITTDFGVFSGDTFMHGVHGFKCNTLQDFVDAARNAPNLKPYAIRKWAERFLMDNVKWQFEKWFQDLYAVWESATIPGEKGWSRVQLTSHK